MNKNCLESVNTKRMKYVESRLQAWKYHYSRIHDGALGYHSKSTLAAWREGYSLQNRQKCPVSLEVNEEAEEVEKIVKEMSDYDERLAVALRCHYFSYDKNIREKASMLNISHSLFRIYVLSAKVWVASRLDFSHV